MRSRCLCCRVLLLVGGLALRSATPAQTTASLEGTVRDATGAVLVGARLDVSSSRLQGVRVTTTDSKGRYRFAALPPGAYVVRARVDGFRPVEEALRISLDTPATLDLTVEPAVEETVRVSAEGSLIRVDSTTTGTNYTSSIIEQLPVARNYADIVRANPGVVADLGDTQGRSLALSIYGATSVENQWVIDGINTTNVIRGMQGKAINNEFVEEVEVKTGGYQAEYGRALGGVINVVTKSGGNAFHGGAFVYYDASGLRATRVFIEGEDSPFSGMRVADYRRADFGADLGGFLLRDRIWFFAAYNRIENRSQLSRYDASELVPTSLRFPLDTADNLYSAKLTWSLAPSLTVVATAFADPATRSGAEGEVTNPDPGTWQTERFVGGTDVGLRASQIFGSTSLLTVQLARHRDRFDLTPSGPGLAVHYEDLTCQGGTREQACAIPPFANFVEGGIGLIVGPPDHSSSRRDQVRADGTVSLGAHELKVGADFQYGKTRALTYFSGGSAVGLLDEYGQAYYEHVFFAGSRTDLTLSEGWDSRPRTTDLGVFVQDSWKVLPNLVVNAGLRWESEKVADSNGRTIFHTTDGWQPRLGVVWSPARDGTLRVYAFAGRFDYALPTALSIFSAGNFTVATTFNFDRSSLEQDPAIFGHTEPEIHSNFFVYKKERRLRAIFQDEVTLGVEKALGSLTVSAKATYRRLGNAIEDRCDLDYVRNDQSGCAILNPGSQDRYARGDFFFCNGLDGDYNNCSSDPGKGVPMFGAPPVPPARRLYRGFELLARKSVVERLWVQASYVFSSLRGNYDGGVHEAGGRNSDPGVNTDFDYPSRFHNGYGRLYLDRPHQLRLDAFYATPLGLSIGAQAWVRSGAPLDRFGYGEIQLVQKGYAGRLPPEWEANLTLEYPIAIGPATVTLQAYVFNLFNNQIRTGQDQAWTNNEPAGYPYSIYDPNQVRDNPNYGKVTSRQDPRLFRAALKVAF